MALKLKLEYHNKLTYPLPVGNLRKQINRKSIGVSVAPSPLPELSLAVYSKIQLIND